MIYWAMLVALVLLAVAVFSTYKDYLQGRVGRAVFTRMRLILMLLLLMFVLMLIGRFAG